MFNEMRNIEEFGFNTKSLKSKSAKLVWTICEDCGFERLMPYVRAVKTDGVCQSCSKKRYYKKVNEALGMMK